MIIIADMYLIGVRRDRLGTTLWTIAFMFKLLKALAIMFNYCINCIDW